MQTLSSIQKIRLMLESDLTDLPLSSQDRQKIQSLDDEFLLEVVQLHSLQDQISLLEKRLPEGLAHHVSERLQKGMRLSQKLQQISAMGIQILFQEDLPQIPDQIWQQAADGSRFLFSLGNIRLLYQPEILFTSDIRQALLSGQPAVFLAPNEFGAYFNCQDLIQKIQAGTLILVRPTLQQKLAVPVMKADGASSQKTGIQKKSSQSDQKEESFADKPKPNPYSTKKVFISGSMELNFLPENVQTSIDTICQKQIQILIGDCNKGADKLVIDYLKGGNAGHSYPFVHEFTVLKSPRSKPDASWKLTTVQTPETVKGREKQTCKDREMANQADWGLAVFNPVSLSRSDKYQVSKGTLRNTIQLLLQGKQVKFFYVFENEMRVRNLKTIQDLQNVISEYAEEAAVENPDQKQIFFPTKSQLLYETFLKLVKSEQKQMDKQSSE